MVFRSRLMLDRQLVQGFSKLETFALIATGSTVVAKVKLPYSRVANLLRMMSNSEFASSRRGCLEARSVFHVIEGGAVSRGNQSGGCSATQKRTT